MAYMLRRVYLSDYGVQFQRRVSPEIGDALDSSGDNAFGWVTGAGPTTGRVPQGYRLRSIDLVDASGSIRRRVEVGESAQSGLWNSPARTVALQLQDGSAATFHVVGRSGERQTFS